MKRHLIISAILTGLCLIRLYPYRGELGLYWRQWSSFQRHFVWSDKGHFTIRRPFLSNSISQRDPEAAAIANFIYVDYNGQDDWDTFRDIEYLAQLSLQYPENQYFLYDLAYRLALRNYSDTQIINKIADRLIQLDPNNGRYYFLKAWATFYDWDDDRMGKPLDYLEACFSSPNLRDPYELYRTRVCRLVEQEHPISFISDWAANHTIFDMSLLRNLKEDLMACTQDLIVNSQADKAMQIHDRLQRLAENNTPQMLDDPWCFYLVWNVNIMNTETPQTVELKWMKLNPQRARQDRQQMLAWKQFGKHMAVPRNTGGKECRENTKSIHDPAVPLAAHGFQMTITTLAAFFVFLAIGSLYQMRRPTFSLWPFLGIILFISAYFFLCRWADYRQMEVCCGNHYTFEAVLSSYSVLAILFLCKFIAIYGLIISGLILGLFAFIFLKKHKIPNLFCRIMLRLLCILFVLFLWLTVSRLQYATLLFDILMLIVVIPLFCFPLRNIKDKKYQNLFNHSPAGMQFRGRCLVAGGYIFVLHIVIFTLYVSHLTRCTVQAVENSKVIWQTAHPPRYIIEPNDYSFLLAQFETSDREKFNLSQWLPMVEPADIPKVLTVLRERREKDTSSRYGPFSGAPVSLDDDSAGRDRECLPDLLMAMDYCGKDALPYVLPFFKDPNSIPVTILRGRFGDTAVRERLVEIWRRGSDSLKSAPDYEAMDILNNQRNLLEALVCICPFSESKQYLIEYYSCVLQYHRHSRLNMETIKLLNRQQKKEIMEAIIPTIKEHSKLMGQGTDLLRYHCDLDTVAKEWLWGQVLNCGNIQGGRGELGYFDLRQKPYDYHISDRLLTECLNNKNDRLRAMGQHIYRKLGKPLDGQILQRWANDSNFVIRANAALLKPEKISDNDPSAFVRLIQSLSE